MADPAQAVVLTRDGSFCAGIEGEVAVTRVGTAYEAAAELLASPTVALVIDLRALSSRHARLLEITRQLGVEMLAVGRVPAWAGEDALSNVRMILRQDLSAAIARIVEADRALGAEPASTAQPQQAPPAEPADEPESVESPEPSSLEPQASAQTASKPKANFELDLPTEALHPSGPGTYVETITQAARRRLSAGVVGEPVRKAPIPAPRSPAQPPAAPNGDDADNGSRGPEAGEEPSHQPPLTSLLSDAELSALLEKEQ